MHIVAQWQNFLKYYKIYANAFSLLAVMVFILQVRIVVAHGWSFPFV